jgi:pimeloyl-ACP methyl ester carboxylesterase
MKKLLIRLGQGLSILLFVGLVWGYQSDIKVGELKKKYANAESEFMELDGMQVHYRDEGNPQDNVPTVLIHGTGSNLLTWDGWTEAFTAKNERVIRLDLPAYGLTGPNADHNYTLTYYADFLHRFLEKLGVKNADIGGNSLGGGIAWLYAATYPQAVSNLILVDAAGYPVAHSDQPLAFKLAKIPVINNFVKYITPKFVIEKSLKNVYADDSKVTPALVDQYFDMACRVGNREAFIKRPKSVDSDLVSKVRSIKTPTLIMWGKQDGLIPFESALKFQKDLSLNQFKVFDDLGHVPHEEDPKRTAEAVLQFLCCARFE